MPDLGPVFGALLELFGPVIGAALKALLKTVFGMALFGAVVTLTTAYFAAQGSWLRALLAAALSLVALAVVTGILAVKNAILRGLLHGLSKLQLGTRVLTLLFNQLGVTDQSMQGERTGAIARRVERLPLREAEAKLSRAVNALLAERAQKTGVRAWLSRKLVAAALTRIEKITLARFRTEDANSAGVDLLVVRDELAATVDGTLAKGITAQLNKLNVLVAGLYVLFAVAIAIALPKLVPG
jgi:hypothetical protein